MTANVYTYHSGQPGIPQLTAAGAAGQLDALLYAVGVTGFGSVTLDSLTQAAGIATATRSAGLNLADGITGMPHIVTISGGGYGWDGEHTLSGPPGATSCTFPVPSGLSSPATGTISLKRAPAGMARLASAGNKAVYQWPDTTTMPGYLMLDDSNAQYAGVRLAEAAAGTVDYSTMTGLCPTVAQWAAPGLYWRKTDGAGGNKPFVIVIWKGGMYVFFSHSNTYPGQYEANYAGACLSLKAADAYPGIVTGQASALSYISPSPLMQKNGAAQAGQYLQRSYPQVGSAIQFTKVGNVFGNGFVGSNASAAYGPADPNPADNANHLRGPVDILEGQAIAGNPIRGQMPLLWDPVNCQNRSSFDILANMPNLPGRSVLLVKVGGTAGLTACLPGIDITGPAGF